MMNTVQLMAVLDDVAKPFYLKSNNARDFLLVVGAITVVATLVFCWAAIWRKKPRHSYHRPKVKETESKRRKHRKRHRRQPDLPMNPTLADTGGWPKAHPKNGPGDPDSDKKPEI
jgi:FtsZ-interacting cell division protein ZipA